MTVAAVVLAGGRSSRMGSPKASLEWHGSTLLRRTVGIVARGTDGPVVVVRAPGQPLPALPDDVLVVDDPVEGRGPLQGIAVGLGALVGRAEAAFVCSTDMPFLHTAFVRRVVAALSGDWDVVLPRAKGFNQPLAAVYRTSTVPAMEALLAADRLRPAFLFEQCRTLRLDDAALLHDPLLAAVDPGLESVSNVNDPDEYAAARARRAPEVTVERFGTLADPARRGPHRVSAATVAEAAARSGLPLDRHVVAAVNGDHIAGDHHVPLAAGDTVAFISAHAGG
jgi:molybdopterin-guanine dinucleotide biosynthesis protein A